MLNILSIINKTMKKKIEDYKGQSHIGIHIKTIDEAIKFDKLTDRTIAVEGFKTCGENLVIYFSRQYSSKKWAENNNQTIFNLSDFLEPEIIDYPIYN